MPEELWTEIGNNVQEVVTRTIPKKNEKQISEEALHIAEKKREAKSKGERKRYTQLNTEFQRMARRYKAFLSKQCKDIEWENLEISSKKKIRELERPREHFIQRWAQ